MNIKINNKKFIGDNHPCFIIAEIGINHNGSIDIAKKLIDVAANSNCDAVKIQKRNPDVCVPEDQKNIVRDTPWGEMTYLSYKKKIEFNLDDCLILKEYAESKGLVFFASCWDKDSVNDMESINVDLYKIASASITDLDLLNSIKKTNKVIIMSTGMSSEDEVKNAVNIFDITKLAIMHSVSTYPSANNEIDLNVMLNLKKKYKTIIGYSGHEKGLQISLAAVAIGAKIIERHITLDRTMWGTDQAASLEPKGLSELVRDIRVIEKCFGTGEKKILESEIPIRKKLRGY